MLDDGDRMNHTSDKHSVTVETGDLKVKVTEQEVGILTIEKLGKTEKTEADEIIYLSDGTK
jgi:hypothetical protein